MASYGVFMPTPGGIYDDMADEDRTGYMRHLAEAKIAELGLAVRGDIKVDWHRMGLVEALGYRGYDVHEGDWLGRAIIPLGEAHAVA